MTCVWLQWVILGVAFAVVWPIILATVFWLWDRFFD